MNIVIIGNSAAGTAAVEAIRHHDQTSSIVQLSDEGHPLYSRCLLSYYLAGTNTKESLLFREADFHHKMKVELHAGAPFRVVALNTSKRLVTCANGQSFPYDRLLIATGAAAKLPDGIPNNVDGIFMLRTWDDAETLKARIPDIKQAIVLGGGLIGVKAAIALSTCGVKTTMLIRSNSVLSQMIDYNASRIISDQLMENNIQVLHQRDVKKVLSKKGRLTGVKTDRGEELECDLLIAAKGVKPNTQLVKGTAIVTKEGIRTNTYMQTDEENVYAAGDVAESFDITLEDYTVNALWTCAMQQGHVAGLNMIGQKTPYDGTIGMNALNVYNTSLISFGLTAPEDESKYKVLVLNQPDRRLYKKIVIGSDNRVKGMILLGRITNAGVLLSIIRRKMDVSQFAHELLSERFDFGKVLKYGGTPDLDRYYNSHLL